MRLTDVAVAAVLVTVVAATLALSLWLQPGIHG